MNIVLMFLCVITLSILRINGIEDREWKLSRKDVREIEKQIQTQKNYTVKTIRTRHGDIYDCVNFYKQPAFNNPSLKNRDFIPQTKSTFSHEKARSNDFPINSPKLGLRGGGCPIGSVPIKRHTKEDLIRIKISTEARTLGRGSDTHEAKCQAAGDVNGVQTGMSTYNPVVGPEQYSAARVKLLIGPDSIEAGWRVDPKLYGDTKTHLYIRTDVRDIHCFNVLCPGFVITDRSIPLDRVLDKISTPGHIYGIPISIISDDNPDESGGVGNWVLRVGIDNTIIGYWPEYLFQKQGMADFVQWGGEVFGPKGTVKPGMGSGQILRENSNIDAFFDNVKVTDIDDKVVDPTNVKCDSDISVYKIISEGNQGGDWQFVIFYGGVPTIN